MDSGSVSQWIPGVVAGNDDAIEKVMDRYYDDLLYLAQKRLVSIPRPVADDEGAVISALWSFCRGAAEGAFPKLSDRNDLWKVLATLTIRKTIAQLRRHWKQSGEGDNVLRGADLQSLLGRGPTPGEAAMLVDECSNRLRMLHDNTLRRIVMLRLEGQEIKEIARQLDVHVRTVQRKLALISREWLESAD